MTSHIKFHSINSGNFSFIILTILYILHIQSFVVSLSSFLSNYEFGNMNALTQFQFGRLCSFVLYFDQHTHMLHIHIIVLQLTDFEFHSVIWYYE